MEVINNRYMILIMFVWSIILSYCGLMILLLFRSRRRIDWQKDKSQKFIGGSERRLLQLGC